MDHVGHDLAPVLVTGGSGYLGRQVLARLEAAGVPCVATSRRGAVGQLCDLTDPAAVRGLLARAAPSVILHCAARVPASAAAYGDQGAAAESVTMLRVLAEQAPCRIALASSMTVYGAGAGTDVDEAFSCAPAAGYARGKWEAEQMLFARGFHGDVAFRLPGLFGLPRRSGVLYNAARAFLMRREFELAATDEPWAAVTVADAAQCLVRAAARPLAVPAQAVNVGYEGDYSVADAVGQIAALCGGRWRPSGSGLRRFSMDMRRLKTLYGLPCATFGQRLGEFVEAVRADLAWPSAGARARI